MTSINDLPPELFPLIFNNLTIKDLFKCRLVNKKFNYFTKFSKGIYKLYLVDDYLSDLFTYYVGEKFNLPSINREDQISVFGFRPIRSFVFNINLTLKYLVIGELFDSNFNLIELSDYDNLEYLEVTTTFLKENQFLKLKNLKILLLKKLYFQSHRYYLETPKLRLIKIYTIDNIHLNNLESIRHLKTRFYLNGLNKFVNLEILEIYDAFIDHNLFDILKNLKLLIIRLLNLNFKKYYDENKNQLIRLLDNRSKLKRRKIDIYFEYVKIDTIKQINRIAEYESSIEFQIKNIDLFEYDLTELQHRNLLNAFDYYLFLESINYLTNQIPSSFYDKFYFIEEVNYDYKRILNSDNHLNILNLYSFIRKLKKPIRFNILNANFDQQFYDNLPDKFHTLSIDNLNSDLNYNFVFKLTKLKKFHNRRNADLFGFALESFSKLDLEFYSFCFQCRTISIFRVNKVFKLTFDRLYKRINNNHNLNYDQLVELCNRTKYELTENEHIIES